MPTGEVCIIGAGMAGLVVANGLKTIGKYDFDIVEALPDCAGRESVHAEVSRPQHCPQLLRCWSDAHSRHYFYEVVSSDIYTSLSSTLP